MWALGIILYQLVAKLSHPFECQNAYAMIDSIKNNEPAPLPSTVSPFIKKLITALLDKNAQSRPDAQTLIARNDIQVYV
jgi:serine/threonine protein kinase